MIINIFSLRKGVKYLNIEAPGSPYRLNVTYTTEHTGVPYRIKLGGSLLMPNAVAEVYRIRPFTSTTIQVFAIFTIRGTQFTKHVPSHHLGKTLVATKKEKSTFKQ